jgi:hypothetical protein
MYRVYMAGKNQFSLIDTKENEYLLKSVSFNDLYKYLYITKSFSKDELIKGFDGLLDNSHNTIEFGNMGTFLYTKFTDFYDV